jgi:hypothetical protein
MAKEEPCLINSTTGSGSMDGRSLGAVRAMDEDLGGEDVKLVDYTIFFTKRGAEVVLQAQREEIVDYPTSEASLAGIKIAEFLADLQSHGIPWPADWKEAPGNGYPAVGQPIRQIPERDRKYLVVNFRVNARRPRTEAELDKDQTDVLRRIRKAIIE